MFREVGLHPDDRDLHRFLQPEPNGGAIQDMRLTRVTFGVTSSPFLATQVLRQQQYPKAAYIVRNHFYADDCLTGADTLEDAIDIRTNLCELFSHAQMVHASGSLIPNLFFKLFQRNCEKKNLLNLFLHQISA